MLCTCVSHINKKLKTEVKYSPDVFSNKKGIK